MNVLILSASSLLFSLSGDPTPKEVAPPRVDYCQQMEQEIQGRKHGFLAGNKTYYIGGFYPIWNPQEDDTIGFTHPFHNDLRGRGVGLVSHPDTGYGHDLQGWEFYKESKVAYGTVIIGATRYEHPSPTSLIWRPDRMIATYTVGGVTIVEEKFIALNDAACTIITSDQPVTLEFAGQSFFGNDSITSTATCELDTTNNCVHVVEGGTAEAKPVDGVFLTGPLMYDGMSTVISASEPLTNYTQSATAGQQFYTFTVPCDSNGLSLVWAMDDVYTEALADVNALLADPAGEMAAKTLYMNDLLNDQIPYFRCSDQDIVDVYYFLWALQLMYTIDVGEGFEQYPHTQTAVNNFLGLHRYDSNLQIPVGAWTADKETYANGNALIWSAMLPFANLANGTFPADNIGKAWYSGLSGGATAHVIGAWKIYEHSGDLAFLAEAYTFYRALMWNGMPGFWGHKYEAADCLGYMALELGYPQSEADHWQTVVNAAGFDNFFDTQWEKSGVTNFFGAGDPVEFGWTGFAYLNMKDFPPDLARDMVETWAMDDVIGFNFQGQMGTKNLVYWQQEIDAGENTNFMITPDTYYFALKGMFASGVYDHAITLTLNHLKNYNFNPAWGIPCAPEAVKANYEFHGDAFSNFNAGKILLILEGIFGLSYSVVDNTFTVADNLPTEWDFMETYVPINEGGETRWTYVRVEREVQGGVVTKSVQVEGNTATKLSVDPWMEGKVLQSSTPGGVTNAVSGHIEYDFFTRNRASLQIHLTE